VDKKRWDRACRGFIIGLPGDDEAHILKDIEFASELNLFSVTFPIAVPFPGTELREMASRNEYGMRILSNNWIITENRVTGSLKAKNCRGKEG